VLVVDQGSCKLYELFSAYPQSDGSWHAGSGAVFDLSSNTLRPSTWTSADAAGLPILPGLVRHDEVASGVINHALRFTISSVRNTFIWPGRHKVNNNPSLSIPPMGQRFRLKASFDISSYPADDQVILTALKTYGMFVADIGSNWFLSGAPDDTWNNDDLALLRNVKGSNFEAVDDSLLQVSADSAQVKTGVINTTNPAATGYSYYLPFVSSNYFNTGAGPGSTGDTYNTYVALQNVGSQSAQFNIAYYGQNGSLLAVDNNNANTPLVANSKYTSPLTITPGTLGAAIVTSNQPLAVIVTEGGTLNGTAVASAYTAVNSVSDSGTTIQAPLALKGAYGTFSTALVIQNNGSTATQANITYYNNDGSSAASQSVAVPAYNAVTVNQQAVGGLPAGFAGWATIKSSTSQALSGIVVETNPALNFFSTVACVGTAGKSLYIPVVFQNAFGNFNTGMALANPNITAANVTVTYYKNDGSQVNLGNNAAASFSIPAFGTSSFYHNNPTLFAPLGTGFVGSAVVSSTQPLIAAVNQSGSLGNNSLTGTFGTILGGKSSVALPTIMNQAYGTFSSGVQFLNTSSVATGLTVNFYNADGSSAGIRQVSAIPPGGVANLYQGGDPNLSTGFNGTLVATANASGASIIGVANVSNAQFFYTYAEPDY
jgi:hypothetical protein